MTDHDALVAAVCANPDDDTPRLAYADWLEENAGWTVCPMCRGKKEIRYRAQYDPQGCDFDGNGYIDPCPNCRGPDPGDDPTGRVPNHFAARAEFIRAQCGLARLGPEHIKIGFDGHPEVMWESGGPNYYQFHHDDEIPVGTRIDVKRHGVRYGRRQRRRPVKVYYGLRVTRCEMEDYFDFVVTVTRDEHSKRWGGEELRRRERELNTPVNHALWLPEVITPFRFCPMFRRGFPYAITCTASDWLRHHEALYWHPRQTVKCLTCHGIGNRYGVKAMDKANGTFCPQCFNHEPGCVPRPFVPTTQPIREVTLTTFSINDWGGVEATLMSNGKTMTDSRWPTITFHLPGATDPTERPGPAGSPGT